ncbi:VCBS repeat-containing protein [Anaeromyxobacter oryzae]|uniref:FG-GAP repeat protein n=1 Tax=Anaeromyxobacter oryzae TaxID=2918170 RepID=A0ABM7WZD8_9BACT|nr:VCBS repeat-containing protein [Anaeromyxobacter oryzae]BDG04911.1 hypothetical protein AMOR_39070 [Anaeromyxobacter oryzae]
MRLLAFAVAVLATAPGTRAADRPSPGSGRADGAASTRAAAQPPALTAAAEGLADGIGPPAEGRRALALAVEARVPALAAPVEAAVEAALARRGYAVTPLRGAADAELAARSGGQDWLLRVQAGLVPGRRELALVGELVPAWASFFLQRRPGARAIPPRVVQARAPADPETLLLGREGRPPGAPFAAVRRLARVEGRVLALAIGEVPEAGGVVIAVATPDADLVLSATGAPVAARALDAAAARPVRDPAAAIAVGAFGGGRIAVQHAGAPQGDVLAVRGGRLEPAGTISTPPLCAAEGARLFGAFAPGTGVLLDVLSPFSDPEARPRSSRLLYGVAAAPRGGPLAFAALGQDLRLELLGQDLGPAGAPLDGVGAGFALADLDGDGTAEVIASAPSVAGPDRVRILAPRAEAPLLLESPPVDGVILAGAAGDLTGDGVDDAVLAAVVTAPGGKVATDLWIVTTDPREAP